MNYLVGYTMDLYLAFTDLGLSPLYIQRWQCYSLYNVFQSLAFLLILTIEDTFGIVLYAVACRKGSVAEVKLVPGIYGHLHTSIQSRSFMWDGTVHPKVYAQDWECMCINNILFDSSKSTVIKSIRHRQDTQQCSWYFSDGWKNRLACCARELDAFCDA